MVAHPQQCFMSLGGPRRPTCRDDERDEAPSPWLFSLVLLCCWNVPVAFCGASAWSTRLKVLVRILRLCRNLSKRWLQLLQQVMTASQSVCFWYLGAMVFNQSTDPEMLLMLSFQTMRSIKTKIRHETGAEQASSPQNIC